MRSRPPPASKARSAPFWVDVSTVKIDKGVPLVGARRATIDWPLLFDKLEIGDSFLLPEAARSAIGTAMKRYKDSTGKALAARKVDGGIRVWRVE